jgi:hypothetical protein
VLPSTSLNRKVTVPVGGEAILDADAIPFRDFVLVSLA